MDQANHQNLGVPPVPRGDTLLLYRIDLRASDNVYKKNWSIFVKKGTKCPFMPPATAMREDGVNRVSHSIEKHLSFVRKKFSFFPFVTCSTRLSKARMRVGARARS